MLCVLISRLISSSLFYNLILVTLCPIIMPPTNDGIVKIAVQMEGQTPQLTTLDQSVPLKVKIADLCKTWGLDEGSSGNYALQFSEDASSSPHSVSRFVTEKNRTEVRNGTILRMTLSPCLTAQNILEKVKTKERDELKSTLEQLVRLSSDPEFSSEFVKKDGKRFLMEALTQNSIRMEEGLGFAVESFVELTNQEQDWEMVSNEPAFLTTMIKLVNTSPSVTVDPKIMTNALFILESVVGVNAGLLSLLEANLSLSNLILHIKHNSSFPEIQQNCLALINALFSRSDLTKRKAMSITLNSHGFCLVITESIIKTGSASRSEMEHQLYVLQSCLFHVKEDAVNYNASSDRIEQYLEELRRLAFESDFSSMDTVSRTTTSSKGITGHTSSLQDDYLKLGFSHSKNPVDDISRCPPFGFLSLEHMLYFARNYTDSYVKMILENRRRNNDSQHNHHHPHTREHDFPFARSCLKLTNLLCHLLKLTEVPSDEGKLYYPMFFTHDHPVEELFVLSIQLLNKTWKEMRATSQDFDKVFSVLQEQLTRALKDKDAVMSFERLRMKLSSLSYNEIQSLWKKERSSREEWENKAKAILQLREVIAPNIMKLIQRQRLQFLTEGTQFGKYSSKGKADQ